MVEDRADFVSGGIAPLAATARLVRDLESFVRGRGGSRVSLDAAVAGGGGRGLLHEVLGEDIDVVVEVLFELFFLLLAPSDSNLGHEFL